MSAKMLFVKMSHKLTLRAQVYLQEINRIYVCVCMCRWIFSTHLVPKSKFMLRSVEHSQVCGWLLLLLLLLENEQHWEFLRKKKKKANYMGCSGNYNSKYAPFLVYNVLSSAV